MTQFAKVGNMGKRVRSDCYIELQITQKGGIQIELQSKVAGMFGKHIKQLVEEELLFFNIPNAELKIIDRGALDHVIMARIEAAVKQLINTDKEFLPSFLSENDYETAKDKFRFTRLYIPGNSPSMMINAGIHQPDGIILDLEDSVAPEKKDEAMILVRNSLRAVNFYGAERMVRINQGKKGIDELESLIPHKVNMLLIPKCESAEYIQQIDKKIEEINKKHSLKNSVWYMPIIESALGVEKAFEIASASPNVASLAIGLEDFTADLGVNRTNEATESFYARTRLVNACKAAGIQAIDSVFSDISDMEALSTNVKNSRALGFDGMGCIHPLQIRVIKQAFTPNENELEKAKKIVLAFDEAQEKGLGVVALGTKMIDPPVVKRAQKTIDLALQLGILTSNWKNKIEN